MNTKAPSRPLKAGTTKATILSKEMTNLRLQERQKNPIDENKRLYKLKKFQGVTGVVNTNRKAFDHH